jgi:hypothetical protein
MEAEMSFKRLVWLVVVAACGDTSEGASDAAPREPTIDASSPEVPDPDPVVESAKRKIDEGRQIFRYDTFGDEAFWSGMLRLHEAVAQISPKQALALGLKVDVDALPEAIVAALMAGTVDLDDPATTRALLQADAVLGVKGTFEGDQLVAVGIQCALCHSTVDDSLAPSIGHRLDGWPNRDLNVGAIISAAPDLSAVAAHLGVDEATVRAVLASWGPGKFDAEVFLDGKAFRPDGGSAATLLPAAFGLAGVDNHTYTGWGSVTYWNAFVANIEMHGQGTFYDPRLDDAEKFPLAAAAGLGHITTPPEMDRVTPKLAALHFYQLALEAPRPPEGSYDAEAATRGQVVFNGPAGCARCHVPPLFTEPGWNMHTGAEIGIDDFQAGRSPDERYRTTPLAGLFTRVKGGFYHDGRFATLDDVVAHYKEHFELDLSAGQCDDLVEYLRSL